MESIPFGLRYQIDRAFELPHVVYLEAVLKAGHKAARYIDIPTDDEVGPVVEQLGSVLYCQETLSSRAWVLELEDGSIAVVSADGETVAAHVAGPSEDRAAATANLLTEALSTRVDAPDEVSVSYWNGERGHSLRRTRKASAPSWPEIELNHAEATRQALAKLMDLEAPSSGRLILWHGLPGSGKTHALKSLIRTWSDWCAPHFISDPEEFLGEASYLLEVVTSKDPDRRADRKWRLVILEDSGELLSADARERTGQALSRMLNLTDGLLGQSTNSLVLVTTNEPLRRLHPAVARTGRCLAEVEFEPLSVSEANEWLEKAGSTVSVTSPKPIADLYALLEGRSAPVQGRSIGFAA